MYEKHRTLIGEAQLTFLFTGEIAFRVKTVGDCVVYEAGFRQMDGIR